MRRTGVLRWVAAFQRNPISPPAAPRGPAGRAVHAALDPDSHRSTCLTRASGCADERPRASLAVPGDVMIDIIPTFAERLLGLGSDSLSLWQMGLRALVVSLVAILMV